jgi:hypothetical protein
MMSRAKRNEFLIAVVLVAPVAAGCATGSGARASSGTATTEQLAARNKALMELNLEAPKACAQKGQAKDNGLIMVTAAPDGSLTVGEMLWSGSEEMKSCLKTEIPRSRLPAWSGPSVTWIWSVGTKEAPPPKALDEAPASYKEKQGEHVLRAQGNAGMGSDVSTGPLSACASRSFSQESYALLTTRLFIFPSGKVVGTTPISNDGEGRDAAYMDCVGEMVRGWDFPSFPGPAFTTLDVTLKYGVNPSEK